MYNKTKTKNRKKNEMKKAKNKVPVRKQRKTDESIKENKN